MESAALGKTFKVDAGKCTGCGECAADCVAEVLEMRDRLPAIVPDHADWCIGCQHCLAVCPTGAVSILGLDPADSPSLEGFALDAASFDLLIRGRRSCRRFSEQPVDPALIDRLLFLAAHAPTGVNNLGRRFTVIKDGKTLGKFREKSARLLVEMNKRGDIPEEEGWLADCAKSWAGGGRDEIFRGAPHMLLVSTAKDSPCPEQDCLIAMSYFDLLANAHGVGTVWAGMPTSVIKLAATELRKDLGIPEDHEYFYCLLFGMPAVAYRRAAQRPPESVHFVTDA